MEQSVPDYRLLYSVALYSKTRYIPRVIFAGAALVKQDLPSKWATLLHHRDLSSAVKAKLIFNIKTTASACTPPRTKIEYLMGELEHAVCKTLRRCLWASASMAQERGSRKIAVEDVLKFPVVARYAKVWSNKNVHFEILLMSYLELRASDLQNSCLYPP